MSNCIQNAFNCFLLFYRLPCCPHFSFLELRQGVPASGSSSCHVDYLGSIHFFWKYSRKWIVKQISKLVPKVFAFSFQSAICQICRYWNSFNCKLILLRYLFLWDSKLLHSTHRMSCNRLLAAVPPLEWDVFGVNFYYLPWSDTTRNEFYFVFLAISFFIASRLPSRILYFKSFVFMLCKCLDCRPFFFIVYSYLIVNFAFCN